MSRKLNLGLLSKIGLLGLISAVEPNSILEKNFEFVCDYPMECSTISHEYYVNIYFSRGNTLLEIPEGYGIIELDCNNGEKTFFDVIKYSQNIKYKIPKIKFKSSDKKVFSCYKKNL
ncbi:MAG: hypothetical protein IH845_03340 [Nanoarchaeota archaeon]|nr:hypothetical protein [Nanoarchaeota archaeon]